MAIQLPYSTDNDDYPDAYWRIDEFHCNVRDKVFNVVLNCYKSRDAASAGKPPVSLNPEQCFAVGVEYEDNFAEESLGKDVAMPLAQAYIWLRQRTPPLRPGKPAVDFRAGLDILEAK